MLTSAVDVLANKTMPNASMFSPEALERAVRGVPSDAEDGTDGDPQLPQLPSMATAPNTTAASWAPKPAPVKGHLDPLSIAALIGGQGMDVGSSIQQFGRGNIETNPMYSWMGERPSAGLAAMKALQTALAVRAMKKLADSGHPTAAKMVGYLGGAAGAAAGIYNMTRPNPHDR
jgi:hypothetical protein